MPTRALVVLAALAAACGPVNASGVINDAELAVARAHAADGDKHAVYETTAADLYLQKAREEQGHAQYGPASDLAKKAIDFATAAAQRANEAKRSGAVPPAPAANVAPPPAAATPAVPPPSAAPPAVVVPPPAQTQPQPQPQGKQPIQIEEHK